MRACGRKSIKPVLDSALRCSMGIKLTETARRVLEKRYLLKRNGKVIETPEQMFRRVAKCIAGVEKKYGKSESFVEKLEEDFYKLMSTLTFLPNSPCLMNAGTELGQLSACFVIPVEDSIEGIFDALKAMAVIQKSGGGTGFSFSRIRPEGDVVRSTGGVASGPVSFMKIFNAATEQIKQGGRRRGANMGILRVDHPDIEKFITAKLDPKELTNFNISVAVTDSFMEAVRKDLEYDLINPRTKQPARRVKARHIWKLIVDSAWASGEPGLVFIDRINKANPTPKLGEIEATNPCVAGDTLVSTAWGLIPISKLAELSKVMPVKIAVDKRAKNGAEVSDGTEVKKATSVFRTGVRRVIRIVTHSGFELKVTPDHKILTTRGWVRASDLKAGVDRVLVQGGKGYFSPSRKLPIEVKNRVKGSNGREYVFNLPEEWSWELGFILGMLIGDGWIDSSDHVCFSFRKGSEDLLYRVKEVVDKWCLKSGTVLDRGREYILSYHSKLIAEFFEKLGVRRVRARQEEVPWSIFVAPEEAVKGFLCGVFSSDGMISYAEGGNAEVRLASSSIKLLKQVQLLLLNLGIFSRIHVDRKPKGRACFEHVAKGGEKRAYSPRGCHELVISHRDLVAFLNTVGIVGSRLQPKIKLCLEKANRKRGYRRLYVDVVGRVEDAGESEVYDLIEPDTHSFIANGIIVHNCGEQPLLPYESCNLGSINLLKVLKAEGGGFEVDWDKLRQVVRLAVRFLDNVIDANKYPLPEIEKVTKGNRKIGLGVMGFHDMLIRLGVRYDSEEAERVADEVMGFIQREAREASVELAGEKGAFPNFKDSIYAERGDPPLRNATLTTIAPTGTISIIAGCSSGIEPIFAVCYTRRILEGVFVEVHPLFEEIAREEGFYSRELIERIAKAGSLREIEEVPEKWRRLFVTAHEVPPEWHVRIQAAFQRHVDNAVSKTINLPNSATREDVEKVFMLAYELGVKGVTVYRDRCREEQVLQKGFPRAELTPRPRPLVTSGKTYKLRTGCGNLYVTINEDALGLCEVFLHIGKSGGCAMAQAEAVGRLISLALRAGVKPEAIVKHLRGIRCHSPSLYQGMQILSCPDAVGIALEKHLKAKEKEKEATREAALVESRAETGGGSIHMGACPECGGQIVYEGGCFICYFCGYSKCG